MLELLSTTPFSDEPVIVTFFSEATLNPPELENSNPFELSLIKVSATNRRTVLALAKVTIPAEALLDRKLRIVHFSTWTDLAEWMRIPAPPGPCPSRSRPRKVTTSVVAAAMSTAMAPLVVVRMPAVPASQEMVSDMKMATLPKSPASRQLISPPGLVLAMAPWKVRHGAVRLQGLALSPVPDTQVRADWACAGAAARNASARPMIASESAALRMMAFLL